MDMDAGLGDFDLVGALRRRLWAILVITWLTTMVAYVIAMSLPNKYTAFATLFVQPQAISRGLVQVESVEVEADIAGQLNLLSAEILSVPRLSRLIDEFGLFPDESKSMTREEVVLLMKSQIDILPVIPELQSGIRRRGGTNSNQYRIIYTADSPGVAARVAERLANDFVKEHIDARVDSTRRGLEFMEAEEERVGQQIKEVEAAIAKVKAENPGRLPEDLRGNQNTHERVASDIRGLRRMLAGLRNDLSYWEGQVASVSMINQPRDDASPLRRLQLLELELAALRARGFTEKHPDVIRTKGEIEEVRATITASADALEDPESEPNLAQQSAEQQRQLAQFKVTQAEEEMASLEVQLAEVETRLVESPAVAEEIHQLQRQIMQLVDNQEDFGDRRLGATTVMNLELRQLGKQFRLLERAVPPRTPSSPNRPVILGMGVLAGLVFAIGLAIVMEGLDSSFHRVREVQSALSIPVLASIPAIMLEADLAAQRRMWIRRIVLAAVLTLVLLGTGAASYVVVNGMPGFLRSLTASETDGEQAHLPPHPQPSGLS